MPTSTPNFGFQVINPNEIPVSPNFNQLESGNWLLLDASLQNFNQALSSDIAFRPLGPLGMISGVGPIDRVVGINRLRSYRAGYTTNETWRSIQSTTAFNQASIRLKYTVSQPIVASGIDLNLKWMFIKDGTDLTSAFSSQAVFLQTPNVPSPNVIKWFDAVLLSGNTIANNSDMLIVVERPNTVRDTYPGSFDLDDVRLFFKPNIVVVLSRINVARINVGRIV